MANYVKSLVKDEKLNAPASAADAGGAVSITTADSAQYFGTVDFTNALITSTTSVGATTINAGRGSDVYLDVSAFAGNAGAVTVTAASESYVNAVVQAQGAVGAVTTTTNGYDSSSNVYVNADDGGIGAVTLKANGDDSYNYVDVNAYSGNIGAISVTALTGASASASAFAAAFAPATTVLGGNIGTITVNATGSYADGTVSAYASGIFSDGETLVGGGNIGAISATANGYSASANVYAYADSGGSIGNITAKAISDSAYVEVDASAYYGNVGIINLTVTGDDASGYVSAYASAGLTGAATPVVKGGNIGTATATATGSYAYAELDLEASGVFSAGEAFRAGGNIGAISLRATGYSASADAYVDAYSGGNIGTITGVIAAGSDNADIYVSAAAYSGSVGAISMTNGGYSASAIVSAYASGVLDDKGVARGGSIGTVTINNMAVSGYVSAYIVTSGVYSAGSASYVPGTAGNIGNFTLNQKGSETEGSAYLYAYSGGNIGAITVNTVGEYSTSAVVSAYAYVGSIGAITVTATGQEAEADVYAYASAEVTTGATPKLVSNGNIGAITLKVTGDDASGYVYAETSGLYTDGGTVYNAGNIGNITVTAGGSAEADVSAYSYSGGNIGNISQTATGASAVTTVYAYAYTGSIGTNTINVNGSYASGSAYLDASAGVGAGGTLVGGNIGASTINVTGSYSDANVYLYADAVYNNTYNYYQGAGNIGAITANLNGHSASAYVYAESYSGGSIGNISLKAKGTEVDGDMQLYTASGGDIGTITMSLQALATNVNDGEVTVSAYVDGTSNDVSKIGATTITVNNVGSFGNTASADYSAYSGSIGNITGTATGGEDAGIYVSAYAYDNGNGGGGIIGNVLLNNSSESSSAGVYLVADTTIGNVTVNATGTGNSQVDTYFGGAADVGNLTISFAATHSGYGGSTMLNMNTSDSDIGTIKITGGSDTSDYYIGQVGWYSNFANSIVAVDASTFNGYLTTDLGGVTEGTTIKAGEGGSDIRGTAGADLIYGNDGEDTFRFLNDDSQTGTIGDLNKSVTVENADIVFAADAGDTINLTGAVETEANYDTLTTNAAGNDITFTQAAGSVNEWVGVYDSATGKFTSSADAASATASTTDVDAVLYLFNTLDAGTTSNQMVVVVGVGSQAGNLTDGVITLA